MREHVFYTDGVWRYVVSPASESGSSVIVEVFCGGRLDATMVVGRSHLLLARFIASEILDTFETGTEDDYRTEVAIGALQRAIEDIQGAIDGLAKGGIQYRALLRDEKWKPEAGA